MDPSIFSEPISSTTFTGVILTGAMLKGEALLKSDLAAETRVCDNSGLTPVRRLASEELSSVMANQLDESGKKGLSQSGSSHQDEMFGFWVVSCNPKLQKQRARHCRIARIKAPNPGGSCKMANA